MTGHEPCPIINNDFIVNLVEEHEESQGHLKAVKNKTKCKIKANVLMTKKKKNHLQGSH